LLVKIALQNQELFVSDFEEQVNLYGTQILEIYTKFPLENNLAPEIY